MLTTRQAPITPNYLTIHALSSAELDTVHTNSYWGNGSTAATTIPYAKLSRVVTTLGTVLGKLGDPPESYSTSITDTIMKRHGRERWGKSDPDMIVTSLETFIQGITQQLGINLEPRHNVDTHTRPMDMEEEQYDEQNDDDDDIDQLFNGDDDDNDVVVDTSNQAACTFVMDKDDVVPVIQRTRHAPIVDEFLQAHPNGVAPQSKEGVSQFVQWLCHKFQIT